MDISVFAAGVNDLFKEIIQWFHYHLGQGINGLICSDTPINCMNIFPNPAIDWVEFMSIKFALSESENIYIKC